jgi:hypothetical protein
VQSLPRTPQVRARSSEVVPELLLVVHIHSIRLGEQGLGCDHGAKSVRQSAGKSLAFGACAAGAEGRARGARRQGTSKECPRAPCGG